MTDRVCLDHVTMVLVEPHIPENIGSVARAMHNMGLRKLTVVNPRNCDLSRVLKTATGSSIDLIEEMDVKEDFSEAVGQFQYIVGTTARTGVLRPALMEPRGLAQALIPLSQENQIAILFGPEDRGLSNEHLRQCHTIATIPTASFSSLNLAQAVMVIAYELFLAAAEAPQAVPPRLANRFELEGMYEHLKAVLTKIGFIDRQNPEHWMINIRRFLSRVPLRARDVRIIRGICRQVDWYTGQHKRDDGRANTN